MKAINIIKTIRTSLFPTKSLVISILLCWLFPNSVWAYDAYVGGIYYNLNSTDRTAEVTYNIPDDANNYSGAVDIPASFLYEGITYSVTSIGDFAFSQSANLTSVIIPNSVTSIGEYIFSDCTNLTSIIVSEGNNNFDSRNNCNAIIETATNTLFFGCKNTVIPNNVTGIGKGAFTGCADLSSMTIPNSVTSIGNGAFANCIRLSSVTIPNSVTSIGKGAFTGCISLSSVTIPNSVTSIGDIAFADCTGLLSITVKNETPPSIDINTFSNVDKVNCKLIVPAGTKTAYENAQYWNEFKNIVELDVLATGTCGDNLTYTIYSDMSMVIVGTGPMYDYSPQLHINNDYYQTIEKVIIEEGVTSIGEYAFYNCKGLTSIEIPNSITSIRECAFEYCIGLTSVTIPNSVTSIGTDALAGCTGLTSVDIPNSVTSIGENAFYGCTGLTSVSIPNSVTSIGQGAFSRCGGLTSIYVDTNNATYDSRENCHAIIETSTNTLIAGCKNTVIPNSVTSIGDKAFLYCSGLTSIVIPNSVTSIGTIAFSECTGLTSIEIPNSVTNLGVGAFYECFGLTSVFIPNSVTTIERSTFVRCNLISVDIPNSVTAIEDGAFYECSGLTSLTIRNSMLSIGQTAFSGCNNLKSVTFHCNEIKSWFSRFSSIQEVIIGNEVTSIDKYAFNGWTNLNSVTFHCNEIKTWFRGFNSIQEVIIGNEVTSIVSNAFQGCTGLTSIEISNSVTSIGNSAFTDCSNLTSVIISDIAAWCAIRFGNYESNPLTFAHRLYMNGEEIKDLEIPNGVTSIGEYAFERCTSLTSVFIPNSVTSIGASAFSRCSSLTTVDIPNSVTTIERYVFYICSSLTSVTIPNSVTSIGDHAFTSCTGLTSLEISNSVSSIGVSAFENCTGLTSLDIPNSVTSIGNQVFKSCTSLTSLVIPNSVTSIGDQSFYNCTGLTSLDIPNSVVSVGEFAFCENRLKTLTIGSGLTRIGDLAFNPSWEDWGYDPDRGLVSIYVDPNNTTYDSRENCNAIIESSSNKLIVGSRNTVIPNSVTTIGWGAFAHTSGLTSVTIPSSVTSIEDDAFAICKDLASIYVECEIPPFIDSWSGINPFHDVDLTNCILYVPKGCISVYESAPFWSDFENIQEKDPDTKISDYDNIVYIEGVEAVSSQQVRLSLKMNNTIEATGFQCDVYLPDGVTAAQDEEGFYLMDISEERTTSRKTDYSSSALLPDGGLRFMCSSTRSYTFSGNEGEVAYLIVDIDPDMEGGSYPLILKNVEISDANSNAYRVSYVKTTLNIHTLGDANNDGSIGVSDFTAIANYIMGMPPASFIEIAADVNADDVISVSDLTGVANIILYGTVSPNSSNAKTRYDVADKYANVGANDVVATTDKEFTVVVNINGNYAYSGYQFDMTLPEGMSVKNVEGHTKASDVFMSGMIDDNTLRVLCASTMGETTESSVVNLTLVADVEGTYRIDIDNAIASADAYSCTMSTSSFLVAIDNNATGISTINDELGSNAAVYDLTGKMMNSKIDISSLPKGIYLINGKKVSKE